MAALAILLGYFIGSIPLGLVIGRLKGIDIRQYGSGKIGATNVLRTLGPRLAVFVLLFDVGKGILIVFLAWQLTHSHTAQALATLAALIGHNWSVFMKFSGGRGVNTGLGGILALNPLVGLAAMLSGLAVIAASRYVSLGSLTGVAACFIGILIACLLGHNSWAYFGYTAPGAVIVFFQHRDNIQRLIQGKERKIGQPAEAIAPTSASPAR